MIRKITAVLCAAFAAASAHAQNPGAPQSASIPIRQLTPAASTDSGVVSSLWGLRALPGGRVMLHDYVRKRIVIFDASMKQFTTVMDSAKGAPENYSLSSISPGLVPYLGDSTLIADRSSSAFLLVAPNGKVSGTLSPPKASDIYSMANGVLDAKGRILYRGFRRSPPRSVPPPPASTALGVPIITDASPDSAPILRGDFDARTVDTVVMLHINSTKNVMIRTDPAKTNGISGFGSSMVTPLPLTDEWTLMPDGTIAIVRGQDYHVDWISMDGKLTSTPKMPFDWKRLTLEDKQQMMDSVKKASDKLRDSVSKLPGPDGNPRYSPPSVFVEPSELPDYYPPVRTGQVKADFEGLLWVLPATSTATGGLRWDVINRQGEIVERVQFPAGRNLIGFGPGGVVYMSPSAPNTFVQNTTTSLERATVIRPAGATIKP